MSQTETVIEGLLKPDGTLVLDQRPNLPAGRVTVVLRQEVEMVLPKNDPFWQRMQAMWAIPKGGGTNDGGENSLAEVRKAREEWDEHQQSLERIQDKCQSARKSPEEPRQ